MKTPTKENLMLDMEKIFEETINWFNEQPVEHFNKEMVSGKWTMAGHLYHLIKSTKGVSKAMGMPRLVLRTTFGKSNRVERTFDQQYHKYIDSLASIAETSGQAAIVGAKFVPAEGRTFDKPELIKRFLEELTSMKKQVSKWKEKDLGVYVLPHPAMGKLTIREMIYFTIFHTKHHLDNLQENYVTE